MLCGSLVVRVLRVFSHGVTSRFIARHSEELSSGGARDGGWFGIAELYGSDDGVKDLPGGPNLGGPQAALPTGKKERRRKRG